MQAPWQESTCNVPMWCSGGPSGFCGKKALGHQYPQQYVDEVGAYDGRLPYCIGHCCPAHGGPEDGKPIIFQDGVTDEGRPMYCAVMPGFKDLQLSCAGFDGNPVKAVKKLKAAIAEQEQN